MLILEALEKRKTKADEKFTGQNLGPKNFHSLKSPDDLVWKTREKSVVVVQSDFNKGCYQ